MIPLNTDLTEKPVKLLVHFHFACVCSVTWHPRKKLSYSISTLAEKEQKSSKRTRRDSLLMLIIQSTSGSFFCAGFSSGGKQEVGEVLGEVNELMSRNHHGRNITKKGFGRVFVKPVERFR